MEFLDCALIGVCAVIRSNTVITDIGSMETFFFCLGDKNLLIILNKITLKKRKYHKNSKLLRHLLESLSFIKREVGIY